MPRTLALIPAKGASTRLPRKNVRLLAGRSLLAWTADTVRASGVADRIIVSTEDEGVAEEARRLGLDVPFMRPADLARDPAGVVQVALHALSVLEAQGDVYDTLAIFLPTCPFRSVEDIQAAMGLFRETGAKFLLSVAPFDHTPFAALRVEDGLALPFFETFFGKRTQELPPAFRPNGAIHLLDVAAFQAARSYIAQPLYAYVMPWERSVDIDTELDWLVAEAMLKSRQEAVAPCE